jgi:hypothetical protein
MLIHWTIGMGMVDETFSLLERIPFRNHKEVAGAYFRHSPNRDIARALLERGIISNNVSYIYQGALEAQWVDPREVFYYTSVYISVLDHAIRHRNVEVARMALTGVHAADANGFALPNLMESTSNKWVPLREAVKNGDEEMIRLLLAYRADPDGHIQDKDNGRNRVSGLSLDGKRFNKQDHCILDECEMVFGRDSNIWKQMVKAIEMKVDFHNNSFATLYPDEENLPEGTGYRVPDYCRFYYRTHLPANLWDKMCQYDKKAAHPGVAMADAERAMTEIPNMDNMFDEF